MTDRIVGLVFLTLSIWYGVTAGDYKASFGDPLGPAAFPMMVAVPAALMSVVMILRPGANPVWATGRPMAGQAATLAVLLGYAIVLERLGFPLATMLGVTLLARLIGTGWQQAISAGVVIALLLYVSFDRLLGLPLPLLPNLTG